MSERSLVIKILMASIRFDGLVVRVIIASLALKYSSACAHEGRINASQDHASFQNELREHISVAAAVNIAGRKGLRGRKMRVDELLKRERESKLGSDEKPKISGQYASKGSSTGAAQNYHLKDQDNRKTSEQSKRKSTRMGHSNSRSSYFHEDASKAFLDAN